MNHVVEEQHPLNDAGPRTRSSLSINICKESPRETTYLYSTLHSKLNGNISLTILKDSLIEGSHLGLIIVYLYYVDRVVMQMSRQPVKS